MDTSPSTRYNLVDTARIPKGNGVRGSTLILSDGDRRFWVVNN